MFLKNSNTLFPFVVKKQRALFTTVSIPLV